MLSPESLKRRFDAALAYNDYLATGTEDQRSTWHAFQEGVRLSEAQRALVGAFTREINILAISGIWCGDCVQQLPLVHLLSEANPATVRFRLIDRDADRAFSEQFQICEGVRVPVVLFLNEDFDFVSMLGDRTLARYRAMAARNLGPACPVPGAPVPAEEVHATLADWAEELERVHLLLRLSTKLRARYQD